MSNDNVSAGDLSKFDRKNPTCTYGGSPLRKGANKDRQALTK